MNDSSHRAGYLRNCCHLIVGVTLLIASGQTTNGQEPVIAGEFGPVASGAPQSYQGGGSFFSQSLNAHLRARYSTQSYGQGEGNFDLGMMRMFDLGDASAFLDGQVTMNDVDGVGYNVGAGYRWLWDDTLAFDPDPMRVVGVSLWSDGSSTINDHFFSQLGISFEALGDLWDFRMNGYLPLGDRQKASNFTPTGDLIFVGSDLAQETSSPRDTALTVGEFELARRIANRDAWAFGGAYGMAGGEFDYTTGVKAGVRGYVFPDLLLQIAVTDDDLFDTNAVFSVIWFIGRTRSDHCATCTVADRLREPVLRNDYVAIAQSSTLGGRALTDGQGNPFSIVHVDSSASAGGDGSFERPFNDISPVFLASAEGDTILLHGGSRFDDTTITLRNNQQLLGEGDGVTHQVTTTELGMVDLPETALGAGALARPRIEQTGAGTSVTLAGINTVNNLNLVGGTVGIDGTTATADPTLRNLQISNTTGDGIVLNAFARDDADDEDGDGDTTEIDFNVTIDQVAFENIGGNDISIDADSGVDPTLANTDLNETINVSNITSMGGSGVGVDLQNTNTGGTTNITSSSFDGNTRGVDISNARGIVNVNSTSIANATSDAVRVTNSTDVNFDTMDIDNAGGRGFNLVHTDDQAYDVQIMGSDINGAATQGIFADGRGTGLFDVQVVDTETTATLAEGFLAEMDAAADEANIEVTVSTFTVASGSAFRLVGNQTASNDIDFLITGNTFTNTSNTDSTVDIDANNAVTLNTTIQNNTLLNNGTASEFTIDTNNANASVRLLLNGNTADGGSGTFDLTNNTGTLTVQDLLNVDTNNTGTVNQSGTLGVDAGSIPTP